MANLFKKVIDRQQWVYVPPTPNAHAAGMGIASDLRNDVSRNPFVYQMATAAIVNRFNIIKKAWQFAVNPAVSAIGAGAGAVFAPSHGLNGAIGAGCSTTSIVTTTVITAVGVNMLANRGGSGDYGFKIRIQGNSAGGSGKTEERWITGNTGGTTPTITLDSPLSFTPANGDSYEILSGRLFMLGSGALAAGSWKSYEIASNTLAALTNTNLPATIATEFAAVALDEQYVPYNRKPGEGFLGAATYNGGLLKCLQATAAAAGSITGGDAALQANEYRNFQVRVVEDTTTPTAVGQHAQIASHTAGAGAVFTLGANWTVTPSATAKFVIEYPNLILLWSSATAVTYAYNYNPHTVNNGTNSITTGAWHVTYFGNRGGNMGLGCMAFLSAGIEPDAAKNARHSFIHSFRGGGTILDILDIAGGTAGTWAASAVYDGSGSMTPAAGTCGMSALADQEGRFAYINGYVASQINQMYRYDVKNRILTVESATDYIQAGTAATGERLVCYTAIDGTDKYTAVLLIAHLATVDQELIIQV